MSVAGRDGPGDIGAAQTPVQTEGPTDLTIETASDPAPVFERYGVDKTLTRFLSNPGT